MKKITSRSVKSIFNEHEVTTMFSLKEDFVY